MPFYKYTARNTDSDIVRGKQEASNEDELAALLRNNGQFLIKCTEVSGRSENVYRPKANELAEFATELGTMLSSGITLVRAMNIILQNDMKPNLLKLYRNVSLSLQRGMGFSEALSAQQGAFPPLMINMFRSGEASGKMDQAAKKVAAHYQKDYKIQGKIKNAMTYPIILIVVGILVMIGVFVFVLPNFFTTFENLNIELPGITKAIMGFSNLLTKQWIWCILFVVALILALKLIMQINKVQIASAKLKLNIPKIGKLMKIIYTARFARTLSTLYTSGLSMLQALNVAADTIGNVYIKGQFNRVIALVRSGTPLSSALKEVKGFSAKLSSVTMIGEESGRLEEMLDNMADSFDQESEKAIDRLIAMLEPAMIIILAVGVGIVMISVLLPIYSMYQSLG